MDVISVVRGIAEFLSVGLGAASAGPVVFAFGGAPSAPPPPADPEAQTKADVKSQKDIGIDVRRRGLDSTILTSPLGVTDTAPTSKKTLLGS